VHFDVPKTHRYRAGQAINLLLPHKPTHISAKEFVHWLAAKSHIDDDSL